MKALDLSGHRYGLLTVRLLAGRIGVSRAWLCDCDCGNVALVRANLLRQGVTKSCGCIKREKNRARSFRHGMVGTPTYNSWAGMLQRCRDPSERFAEWGGRGITVCDRWNDFNNFHQDMGARPPGMTLDRVEVDGNYEPGNCRWATRAEQNQNTRKNRFLTFRGETLCLRAWARRMGLHPTTLTQRLDLYGWPVEKALTTKPTIGKQPRR